jgi:prepilin-type N-terminal cleavage/methylation domain-containing protein
MKLRKMSQRGDTIIEVLISIAVVSLILGGAFATTRRSQEGVRDSQEHAQALKLLESQLEQVRADATKTGDIFAAGTPFCMYGNTPVSTSGATASTCVQNGSGQPSSAEPAYSLSITRNTSSGGFLFTIQAQWDSVTGDGKAQEQMVYRLYQ